MFTEMSVHFSHSIHHHIPKDKVSTVSTSNLTTNSSAPEECQLQSAFFYHSQSALAVATLQPAADILQETTLQCCHIQRPAT